MYVVVFEGLPDKPEFFRTKQEASSFKAEHPNGKFAAVMRDGGTTFEGYKNVGH